jgi:hypothetical protein
LIILLVGSPGSGKGTQCELLAQAQGWGHLSSGEIFRDEIDWREFALRFPDVIVILRLVSYVFASGSRWPFNAVSEPVPTGLGLVPGLQNTMIDHIPVPAADVEMEVVDGEVLLYHPQQTRAIYLNPTAAVVWGLCDGSRSVREIIRVIGESYPDAGSVTDDVLATLTRLRESGVLVAG